MLPMIPKELIGKIDFRNGTVNLTCEVTEEVRKIFEKFKREHEERSKHRYD